MSNWVDVTKHVEFGLNDDESLPLKKCVCGLKYDLWDFILSVYKDNPTQCYGCGRKYYFSLGLRVYMSDEEATGK